MHKVGFVLFAHPNSSQTVANLGMAQLSVPVVSSEPPRPRNRDRSVCGPDAPHLAIPSLPSRPFPTVSPVVSFPSGQCLSVSPVVSFPSGQFPQWSVVSVGQFPQWSVSPVVSGSVVRFPSGQFPQWSVVSVGQFPRWSVSPVQSARLSRHDHSRLCLLRLQHQVGEANNQGSAHDDSDHDARNRAAA